MAKQSLTEFIESTTQRDEATGTFVLETTEMLEVNLSERVWAKVGSMIAYTGSVQFARESALEQGLTKFIKKKLTGEGAPLMKMEGSGRVYLADQKKKVSVFDLQGESLSVNGNDLLAMEDGVSWDIEMLQVSSMLAGGLFNVKLSGRGLVAVTSHGKPLTLKVEPGAPVFTDPQATVAWSGSLRPEVKTNVSLRGLLGRGSGEAVQLQFSGSGWVVVQPAEEVPFGQHQGQGQQQKTDQSIFGQLLGG